MWIGEAILPPRKGLSCVWDNYGLPRITPKSHVMTTTIRQADLIESVSAALQYIS